MPHFVLVAATLALLLTGCYRVRVAAVIGRPGSADHRLGPGITGRLIVEPDDGVGPVTRALDRAQRSIFVEAYILSSRTIIHALERASAQSVTVRVLLEQHALGMGTQPKAVADQLRAAGVAVRWAPPAFALMHSKAILIDGATALISTANYSRAGFSTDRDFLVWDRYPRDVHELEALLRDDWDRAPSTIDAPNLVVAPASARAKLDALVSSARVRVDVYGEEMADPDTERLLSRVACSGLMVRVLLPARPARGSPIFRRSCVHIRLLTHPYIHAKIVAIDGRRAFLGSENISTQSLERNREIGVLLRGRDVRTLSQTFERDWRHGLPVRSGES